MAISVWVHLEIKTEDCSMEHTEYQSITFVSCLCTPPHSGLPVPPCQRG